MALHSTAHDTTDPTAVDPADLVLQMFAAYQFLEKFYERAQVLLAAYRALPTDGLGEEDLEGLDRLIENLREVVEEGVFAGFFPAMIYANRLVQDPAVPRFDDYETTRGDTPTHNAICDALQASLRGRIADKWVRTGSGGRCVCGPR